MSTDEIAKTIQVLKVNTIQEALKQSGCKAFQNASSKTTKPELIKMYERQVMDVGIDKFINRINNSMVTQTATLLGVESEKKVLVEKVQELGISAFLSKASFSLLTEFVTEMGLQASSDKGEAEQSIADEAMLTGMEGFLHSLTEATLKKHCTELSLGDSGVKKDMVERLMVHIFELEPLEKTEEEAKKQEEEKSKDSKKRKDTEKEKEETPAKKSKKAEKAEKAEKEEKETPKRATRGKKAEDSDESDSEEEKKDKKTPKKDKSAKSPKKGADDDTPGKRQAWVAPPLTSIVKGAYTYQQFYDLFNLTDLQQYSKNEGLKGKGVKKDVIRDIMRYLETGEKEDESKKKKKGKKGKTPKKEKADGKDKEKTDKEEKDEKEEKEKEKEKDKETEKEKEKKEEKKEKSS